MEPIIFKFYMQKSQVKHIPDFSQNQTLGNNSWCYYSLTPEKGEMPPLFLIMQYQLLYAPIQ